MKMCISGSLAVRSVTQGSRAMEVEEMKPQGAFALKPDRPSVGQEVRGTLQNADLLCSTNPAVLLPKANHAEA